MWKWHPAVLVTPGMSIIAYDRVTTLVVDRVEEFLSDGQLGVAFTGIGYTTTATPAPMTIRWPANWDIKTWVQ